MAFRLPICEHGNKRRSCRVCEIEQERVDERELLGPSEHPIAPRWKPPAGWTAGYGPGVDEIADFVGDLGPACDECVAGFVYKHPRNRRVPLFTATCSVCGGTGFTGIFRRPDRVDRRRDPFERNNNPLGRSDAELRFDWD